MAQGETYVLLDVKGLVRYSYNAGTDPDGVLGDDGVTYNTASYGLSRLLECWPIFEDVPPRQIIAVWDGGNDYRKLLWPEYKAKRHAKREEADPALVRETTQLDWMVRSMLGGLGCTQVSVPGVEADDVIAWLCQKLVTNPILIHTVDGDMLQLSGMFPDRVMVMLSNKLIQHEYKPSKAVNPIPLELIRLNKSIVGDSSDEYPGVVGMGDKAWDNLHQAYGTDGMLQLEQLLLTNQRATLKAMADSSGDKNLCKLVEQWEHWFLQYRVATLYPELCEGVNGRRVVQPDWDRRVPSWADLIDVFDKAQLKGWYDRLKKWLPRQLLADYTETGNKVLQHFQMHVNDGPICAFDYESYDPVKWEPFQRAKPKSSGEYVDVLSQQVTGVSFCYGDNYQHNIYMPCRHKDTANYEPSHVAWAVHHAASQVDVVAHNASFELAVTYNDLKTGLPRTVWDTFPMASHVDENLELGLKQLSSHWLGYPQMTYKETLEKHGAADMSELTGEQTVSYGCDDSTVTAHLFDLFWLILTCEGTWEFVRDKEFEFVHETVRGFLTGVKLDADYIKQLDVESREAHDKAMQVLREKLPEHCSDFNQPGAETLFFDLMELESAKAEDEGWSTEKIDAVRNKLWERCYLGSQYIPYQVIQHESTLKPTNKPLSKTAELLGFSNPVINKTSKKFFETWIGDMRPEAAGDEDKTKFLDLLRDVINAGALKKPETDSYKALLAFIAVKLDDKGKVEEVGDELNFNSPNQMQELLYCKLGLPIRVRSKIQHGSARHRLKLKGSPSTDAKAVNMAFAEDVSKDDWRYPILEAYRTAKTELTAQSLFYGPLPLWVHPADGMTHPQIKNCGTVTRRPSGTSFNILQLTKKDGGKLRSSIKPRTEEHVIVSADFNGQELRILTSECQDPALVDAYIGENKKDVHSLTAAAISPAFLGNAHWVAEHEITGQPVTQLGQLGYEDYMAYRKGDDPLVAKAMNDIRKAAKGVNFLIVYMGGYDTLALNLLIKVELAKQLMDQTFKSYPRVKEWQQETIEFARKHGYTITAYGTRRHLGNGLFSDNDEVRSRLERQGVNSVIQGGAAGILKEVMAAAYRRQLFEKTGSALIAPIYDELAATVPKAAVVDYCLELKEIMEVTPPGHNVPMLAEFSVSEKDFGSLVELGADINHDIIHAGLAESLETKHE